MSQEPTPTDEIAALLAEMDGIDREMHRDWNVHRQDPEREERRNQRRRDIYRCLEKLHRER